MTEPIDIPELIVQTRESWAKPWRTQGDLDAERIDWPAGRVSQAVLTWRYGERDGGEGTWQQVPPLTDVADHFVRICRPPGTDEGSETIPVWHGIVLSESDHYGGPDAAAATGVQELTAHGLEVLLERAAVTGSMIERDAAAVEVREVLPFNLRARAGHPLVGNRSSGKYAGPGGLESHVFSDAAGAAVWTGAQILEYLLAWYGQEALGWRLAGDTKALASWRNVLAGPGTVAEAVRAIVHRRRGHTWRVEVWADGEARRATLVVCSCFREKVAAGGVEIDGAGSYVETIDLDAEEVCAAPIVRRDRAHEFDRVEALGQPVILIGTVRFSDDTLVKGWGDGAESLYVKATTEDRKADRYAHVFRTFKLDPAKLPAGPTISEDGWPVDDPAPPQWTGGKGLLSRLPVQVLDDDPDGPATAFRRPLVVIPWTPPGEGAVRRWAPLDRPLHLGGASAGMHVAMLDGELGFRASGKHNHYLAANHWPETAKPYDPTREPICFDYEDLVATVAWPSSERLRVVRKIRQAPRPDCPRTLRIEVPDAECWYRLPKTVLDGTADEDGELPAEEDALTIRLDRAKLAAVAALAAAWYQRPRAALTVRYGTLAWEFVPGMLIREAASDGHGSTEVNTAISRITWDCRTGRTTLQTDFAELDFPDLAGLRAAGGGLRKPALSAPEVRGRLVQPIAREAEAPTAPRRGICRIVTNEGAGEYTVTEQRWDADGGKWVDSAHTEALEKADATAWLGGAFARPGRKVAFWQETADDGSAQTLLKLGSGGWGAEMRSGAIGVHYSGTDTTAAFVGLGDVANALIAIATDLRKCLGNGPLGHHPGWTDAAATGGFDYLATWGADGTWQSLCYTARQTDGTFIKSDPDAIANFHVQARVNSGQLELRIENTAGHVSACLKIWMLAILGLPPPGEIEVGNCCCHEEPDTSWGDGEWSE